MTAGPATPATYAVGRVAPGVRTAQGRRTGEDEPSELFLAGKLPWEVLKIASRLPGAAFRLCTILQFLRKVERRPTVLLRRRLVEDLAVKPKAEARALAHLERAGLVSVERRQGRRPRVTPQWNDEGLLRSTR